jgi:hypothetical protein
MANAPKGKAMDEEFRARVERARQMTPAERVREGFRLREVWLEQLLLEVKAAFPNATHEEAMQMRGARLQIMQRKRSAEKSRMLDMIAAENDAKQSQTVT